MELNKLKLIREQFIKDNSALMQNVENQFIGIHILEAQNIEMRYTLGDDQFEEIITEYFEYAKAGYVDINTYVSTQNQYIRNNYIKWILLYYTLYHSIFDLDSKLTNKGIVQQNSSYSTNVYSKQVEERRKDWKNKAETYVSRLIDYLQANIDDFPLYKSFISDDCNNTTPRFDNGWYFGDEL